jgi:hypothetical protein
MRPYRDDGTGIAMPYRAPSIRSCGCILRSGETCQHQRARRAEADKQRPSARQRGYDTAFQRAAATFLKDHPTCTCGAPAVLVRHRISIRKRPDLRMDRSNWLPGCRRCNAKDVQRERKAPGGGANFAVGGRDRVGRTARDRAEISFSGQVTE